MKSLDAHKRTNHNKQQQINYNTYWDKTYYRVCEMKTLAAKFAAVEAVSTGLDC